ncbi:MAG TPA: DUF3530 family protein, partial [Marinagarivorans sp.]
DSKHPPLGPPRHYRYHPIQRQTLIETELQHTDPFAQPVWLEAEGRRFLAIWHKDRSGNPQGAVLIIPDENTSPASKRRLANTQFYLSEHGWSTLTLAMPEQPSPKAPPRPAPPDIKKPEPAADNDADDGDANTPSDNSADTEPVDETQVVYDDSQEDQSGGAPNDDSTADTDNAEQTAEPEGQPEAQEEAASPTSRIRAGLDYLTSQSQYNNVIFATGTGAAYALATLYPKAAIITSEPATNSDTPDTPEAIESVTAIILLNAKHSVTGEPSLNFLRGFQAIDLPLLDIIDNAPGKSALEASAQDQAQRQSAAKTSNIVLYQSRKIHPAPLGQKGEQRASRIIRGFLKQNVRGMEKNNTDNTTEP